MALKAPVSNAPVEMTNDLTTDEPTVTIEPSPDSTDIDGDVWFDFQPTIATFDYACPLSCSIQYEVFTIRQLKKFASTAKVKGYSKLTKAQLIEALA